MSRLIPFGVLTLLGLFCVPAIAMELNPIKPKDYILNVGATDCAEDSPDGDEGCPVGPNHENKPCPTACKVQREADPDDIFDSDEYGCWSPDSFQDNAIETTNNTTRVNKYLPPLMSNGVSLEKPIVGPSRIICEKKYECFCEASPNGVRVCKKGQANGEGYLLSLTRRPLNPCVVAQPPVVP